MDRKRLVSLLDESLIARGFRRKASSWYRQSGGVLQVFNLQKSAYGGQYYVNLCFVPNGMEVDGMPTPPEHKCPIRIRLDSVYPERSGQIKEVFDLEDMGHSDESRAVSVTGLMQQLFLPFMDDHDEVAKLRQAIAHGTFERGAVSLAVRRFLNTVG